jgi:hypothetical protein
MILLPRHAIPCLTWKRIFHTESCVVIHLYILFVRLKGVKNESLTSTKFKRKQDQLATTLKKKKEKLKELQKLLPQLFI